MPCRATPRGARPDAALCITAMNLSQIECGKFGSGSAKNTGGFKPTSFRSLICHSTNCATFPLFLLTFLTQYLLYCPVYYTILYYTILYYTILYYTILYYTILYYTILYYCSATTQVSYPASLRNFPNGCQGHPRSHPPPDCPPITKLDSNSVRTRCSFLFNYWHGLTKNA